MDRVKILNFDPLLVPCAFCVAQRFNLEVIQTFKPVDDTLYLIFGGHLKAFDLYANQQENKTIRYIIYNSVNSSSDYMNDRFYVSIMKSNIVFDHHVLNMDYLQTLGVRVYSKFVFDFPYYPNFEKPIDIMYVGKQSPAVSDIYYSLGVVCPNLKIEFHYGVPPPSDGGLRGDCIPPYELMKRAKYVLNLGSDHLDTFYIHKALSYECKVVSRRSNHAPTDAFYAEYIHFVDQIVEYFKDLDYEIPKYSYTHLVSKLSKYTTHNLYILNSIIN